MRGQIALRDRIESPAGGVSLVRSLPRLSVPGEQVNVRMASGLRDPASLLVVPVPRSGSDIEARRALGLAAPPRLRRRGLLHLQPNAGLVLQVPCVPGRLARPAAVRERSSSYTRSYRT